MISNKNGTILITTLWILTILSILAMGIGFRVSIEARLSKHNLDRTKGLYLAKAGIVKAMEVLSKDNNGYDSIRECGITLPPDKMLENVFAEKLSDGAFTVSYEEGGKSYPGIMDEERKININKAEYKVLYQLFLGMEPDNLAASIINWRGPTQATVEGAQDKDYESLEAPYKCKHAEFSCIEELLLIKGMTPEILESVKGYITVYGDEKININTASERVLKAYGLTPDSIGSIMMIRNGIDNTPGTKNDGWFDNIGTVANQIGLPPDSSDRAVLTETFFKTKSEYFRIEATGAVDKSKIVPKIVCVVKRAVKSEDRRLLFYREY